MWLSRGRGNVCKGPAMNVLFCVTFRQTWPLFDVCVLGVMESAQERDSGSCRTCGRALACSKHPANVHVSFSGAFKADGA